MDIIPKGQRIVIELIHEIAGSKIVLPESVNLDDLSRFQVVAVGDGRVLESGERVPIALQAGDTVVISPHAGYCHKLGPEWLYGGRKLMVCDVSAVMCVVKQTPEEMEQLKKKALSQGKIKLATERAIDSTPPRTN